MQPQKYIQKHFCFQTTTGDDVKDFARQLKNKITKKHRSDRSKKGFINYNVPDKMDSDR